MVKRVLNNGAGGGRPRGTEGAEGVPRGSSRFHHTPLCADTCLQVSRRMKIFRGLTTLHKVPPPRPHPSAALHPHSLHLPGLRLARTCAGAQPLPVSGLPGAAVMSEHNSSATAREAHSFGSEVGSLRRRCGQGCAPHREPPDCLLSLALPPSVRTQW